MSLVRLFALAIITLSLTACQEGQIKRQDVAGVLGAVGGAYAGSQIGKGSGQLVATAAGAVAGYALGNWLGENLDEKDRTLYQQNTQHTLEYAPVGKRSDWHNPDSSAHGYTVPTRTFQSGGQYCREFTQTIYVGQQQQEAYGTACRQADGSWQIVN